MHRKLLFLLIPAVALIAFLAYRKLTARPPEKKIFRPAVITADPSARSEVPSNSVEVCGKCHAAEYELWRHSQHARANRLRNQWMDKDALSQQTLEPEAVIGVEPLVQYLVAFPGGRLQTFNPAYDPMRKEWFDSQEPKTEAQDWGYWKNRGMNWNSQCAFCHVTNLVKGYDSASDTYKTTWDAMGITCAQCHGAMKEHAANPTSPVKKLNTVQIIHNCASCHSRRGETTGMFQPGDAYLDHFRPVLPNESNLYYADGQVRGENYEYGSFLMSRMGYKGVVCMDCHNPHSGKLKISTDNNGLCMSCHASPGIRNAIVIDPANHLHHKEGSKGNLCIECHMPVTKYMVRDPRRDHGFTSPDPLLTKELGIPNACNRCHVKETSDWALKWAEQWYGKSMEPPARARARLIARAQSEDETVVPELLTWIQKEEIGIWRATMISLLAPWTSKTEVQNILVQSLSDSDPLVRSAAVQTLQHVEGEEAALSKLRSDPVRLVRLYAAWATLGKTANDPKAYAELVRELDINSDQPLGAVRQSQFALIENRPEAAERWMRKAVAWDASSAGEQQLLGQVLNAIGKKDEAVRAFETAAKMEPQNAEHLFFAALVYGELNRNSDTIRELQRAVQVDPKFARAWYNLGLAYAQVNQLQQSIESLEHAGELMTDSPEPPYALATIYIRMGNIDQARTFAEKALSISPGFQPASALLNDLKKVGHDTR